MSLPKVSLKSDQKQMEKVMVYKKYLLMVLILSLSTQQFFGMQSLNLPEGESTEKLIAALTQRVAAETKHLEPLKLFGYSLGIRSETLINTLLSTVPFLLLSGWFTYKIMKSKLPGENDDRFKPYKSTIRLHNIAGKPHTGIQIILDKLKRADLYAIQGAKPVRNFLFYGPPGTGKTSWAEAIANEIDAPLIKLKSTEFPTGLVGGASRTMSSLFEHARSLKPKDYNEQKDKPYCLIFLDEIDALGQNRNNISADHASENPLTPLMNELDNPSNNGIVLIGATNLKSTMDPALLRRFKGGQFRIGLPDKNDLHAIAEKHGTRFRTVKMEEEVLTGWWFNTFKKTGKHTTAYQQINDFENINLKIDEMHQHKFSGADVELTLDKAREFSVFRKQIYVTQRDFDEALTEQIKAKKIPHHMQPLDDEDDERDDNNWRGMYV